MRLFACYLLAALCMSTDAFADAPTLERQITSYLFKHPPAFAEELKAHHGEVSLTVVLSIDREGKLLSERVARGSGLKTVDQETLDWLRRIQPYPQIPADMQPPFEFTFDIRFDEPSWNDDRVKRAMQNVCKGC